MNELHLFAGVGGGILGGILLGHRTVCAVELEPYCRKVLLQRQRDGILPKFPIWDDVCTFDGTPWKGKVDIVCGGFPCQDISSAGGGAGIEEGTRSGLWYQMARIISEIRPRFVFIENSPLLRKRGLNKVLRSLAEMGYDARWGVLGARNYGGPVERERIWVACSHKINGEKRMGFRSEKKIFNRHREQCPDFWLQAPSKCFGMEHGMDSYVDQVSAIGNGQVPIVAASAFRILKGK